MLAVVSEGVRKLAARLIPLPIHRAQEQPFNNGVTQPPIASSLQESDSASRVRHHVLLLSHQDDLRRSLRLHLENLGYRVTEASDMKNARAILAADCSLDIGIVDRASCCEENGSDTEELEFDRLGDLCVIFADGKFAASSRDESEDAEAGTAPSHPVSLDEIERRLKRILAEAHQYG